MKIDVSKNGVNAENEHELLEKSRRWFEMMHDGGEYTGWVKLPYTIDKQLIKEIKKTAEEIREKCTLLIVIGIGGSYLGARAVIDALNGSREDWPEIVFAGFNMSAAYLKKVEKRIKKEAVCICVISKSGRTAEPLLSYAILKEKMIDKYGREEAFRRIIAITDKKAGILRAESCENGYRTLEIPGDVGGRFSVLTAAGLLPVACAGHDIEMLIQGAAEIAQDSRWEKELLYYTVSRIRLQQQGKHLEIFEYFEANLAYFGEWLRQLFGESEGKDGKGAYPTNLCFSRDLHSIGQFLQQGKQIFYETLIKVEKAAYDFKIPDEAGYPFAGKSLETINGCSEQGVVLAHYKSGIPVTVIEIEELNPQELGRLIYFFEMSCALSAYNLGVNPFDQPGVENYKNEMRRLVEQLD